jgi:hypothetical protein
MVSSLVQYRVLATGLDDEGAAMTNWRGGERRYVFITVIDGSFGVGRGDVFSAEQLPQWMNSQLDQFPVHNNYPWRGIEMHRDGNNIQLNNMRKKHVKQLRVESVYPVPVLS